MLTSTPVLSSQDFEKTFILQTDASNYGIGAVLSQTDREGLDYPVAYLSHKLLDNREQKYSTIENIKLIVKFRNQTCCHSISNYLLGQPFIIQTDHLTLQWLSNVKDENSHLARWSLALQPYQFEIEHRKGRANANVDSLSRAFTPRKCCTQEKREEM